MRHPINTLNIDVLAKLADLVNAKYLAPDAFCQDRPKGHLLCGWMNAQVLQWEENGYDTDDLAHLTREAYFLLGYECALKLLAEREPDA